MSEDNKAYTDEEFALILRKAAELASESDASQTSAGELSMDDMKSIAAEAGLDPSLIERAARMVPSQPGGSPAGRLFRRLFRRRLSAFFSTRLTRERSDHLLAAIRAATGEQGAGETTSSGLAWRGFSTAVTIHNESDGSRVHATANLIFPAFLAQLLGVMAGWVTIETLGPGSLVLGLLVALGTWAPLASRNQKRMEALMETISRAMVETGDLPKAAEEEGVK
jgi:hypothetical protein